MTKFSLNAQQNALESATRRLCAPGHHIGDLPDEYDDDQMDDQHRRGYDTINSRTYRVLIAEGLEPGVFRNWGPSQICEALDNAPLV